MLVELVCELVKCFLLLEHLLVLVIDILAVNYFVREQGKSVRFWIALRKLLDLDALGLEGLEEFL